MWLPQSMVINPSGNQNSADRAHGALGPCTLSIFGALTFARGVWSVIYVHALSAPRELETMQMVHGLYVCTSLDTMCIVCALGRSVGACTCTSRSNLTEHHRAPLLSAPWACSQCAGRAPPSTRILWRMVCMHQVLGCPWSFSDGWRMLFACHGQTKLRDFDRARSVHGVLALPRSAVVHRKP